MGRSHSPQMGSERLHLYLQKKELDKRNIILLEIKNLQELTDQGIELTEIVRMIKEEGEKKE